MATPTLRRDQHMLRIPPSPLDVSSHPLVQQQWRSPMADHYLRTDHSSRVGSSIAIPLSAGFMLPKIASLLNAAESSDVQTPDRKKRKPSTFKDAGLCKSVHEGSRVSPLAWDRHSLPPTARNTNVPVVSRIARHTAYRADEASYLVPVACNRVRPAPVEISSHYMQTQQNPLDASPFRLSRDPAGRRRLFYSRSSDPLELHALSESPRYHQELARRYMTNNRFDRRLSLPHTHTGFLDWHEAEGIEMGGKKRRRVVSLHETSTARQSLYESEYGLTCLETSESLMHSRGPSDVGESSISTFHVQGNMNDMDSPIAVSSRITYSEDEGILRTAATKTKTQVPTPRMQTNQEKRTSFPLTMLMVKFKEFLKSKSLVRNRHDEIDWVATFLNVGFETSGIYALMCPLRKGRWKPEEENYTMGLLRLIENGTILLRQGQSIRGYIGEKLHSDDMRVLKKLSNCKMYHFAKLINPRLTQNENVDMSVIGAQEGIEQLERLKGEFLRSVQLEALVAVRKHLSDSSLSDLLNVHL